MKYLGNDRNLVRGATLSATNIVASQALYRTDTEAKSGGGRVALQGSYTGLADTDIDVRIAAGASSTRRLSQPVFSGVGNGAMSGLSATSAVDAQEIVVTLEDLGTATRKAYAPFQGVTLRARDSGPAGNDITITVDADDLVSTATDFSVQGDIREGANDYVGDEWNFGAATLNPDGTIPDTAPRIRFGDDPQVYRQYRWYAAGQYHYGFSPAPVRDAVRGTPVKTVSGSRTVTITDGTTTDTLTGIVTLYDCLTAIGRENGGGSSLVYVDGVVVNDKLPGGQGATDLSVWTEPYVQAVAREGSSYIENAPISFTISASAPTEQLLIRCTNNDTVGAEVWSVAGDSSGSLSDAITGVLYSAGAYGFTIPQRMPGTAEPGGSLSIAYEPVGRAADALVPGFCAEDLRLGVSAVNRTYRFVYTARPSSDCDCETGTLTGAPNDDCLGIEDPEGGSVATEIPANVLTRVQSLHLWLSGYVTSQMNLEPPVGIERSADFNVDAEDVRAAREATELFQTALFHLGEHFDSGATELPAAALTEYDSAFTALQADFASIAALEEYNLWGAVAEDNIQHGDRVSLYLQKWETRLANLYAIAGVDPRNFDVASTTGGRCWQDTGASHYFRDEDGRLLPIFPGVYYHSARLALDEFGRETVVSTEEFGFGPRFGCIDSLAVGDVLEITVTGVANPRSTYQVGDEIRARIVRVSPLEFGGGQTGDDVLTFSVVGSEAGQLDDYALHTPTGNAYSDGGLGFLITPGGIDFALGDQFRFSVEAALFEWRRDGGAWEPAQDIGALVALDDGLAAVFTGGAAPSWVEGDTWSFTAEATNGPEGIRQPTDARMTWEGELVLEVALSGAEAIDGLLIAGHTIPAAATILLEASSDGFSTTPLSQAIPWRRGTIWHAIDAEYATYRLTISDSGSIQWLWLAEALQLSLRTGVAELGRLTKRYRLPTSATARALGGSVEHAALSQSSVDDLLAMLEHACENDQRRFGIAPNDDEAEGAIVAYAAESLDVDDEFAFQPRATADRLLTVRMQLEPTL